MIAQGIMAAVFTGIFAGVGGLLIFFKRNYGRENINLMLNVAAGVMLASSIFTLLTPAVTSVMTMKINIYLSALLMVLSVAAGIGLVWIFHFFLPHEHELPQNHSGQLPLHSALLFVIAIAIHKFPEGLAVGVAYAGEQLYNPRSLAVGIALQNIPEGLIVAVSLAAVGFSRVKAVLLAALTGLMQPLGAFFGVVGAGWNVVFIPFGMAIAGGTMLFVIINEVLPETYGEHESYKNTTAVMVGFLIMMYINMVIG